MRKIAFAVVWLAGIACAQPADTFKPAGTNVWGAEYPRVDDQGRVQVRIKAPEANKVRLNFWSGPKMDMEKQADGFAITAVHLTLRAKVPGADQAKLAELADKAKQGCPVSKLFKAPITLDAALA